jgi:hypothetical protein
MMKRMMNKTLVLFLAVMMVLALFATIQTTAYAATCNVEPRGNSGDDPDNGIYVSPSGNDATATGSIGAPYKSINTALAAAKPGDTLVLRGGTYREGVNTRVRIPNITIKSRKDEWAVIDLTT